MEISSGRRYRVDFKIKLDNETREMYAVLLAKNRKQARLQVIDSVPYEIKIFAVRLL